MSERPGTAIWTWLLRLLLLFSLYRYVERHDYAWAAVAAGIFLAVLIDDAVERITRGRNE